MNLSEIINQEGATLIDVREPYEYESKHADGALNIPLGSIPYRVEEITQLSSPIIIYCASGNRSNQAFNYLVSKGLENVYDGGGLFEILNAQHLNKIH